MIVPAKVIAEHFGVNLERIYFFAKDGRLGDAARKNKRGHWEFDKDKTIQRIKDTISPHQPSKINGTDRVFGNRFTVPSTEDSRNISEIRREHEALKVGIKKIELEKRRGEVIHTETVHHAIFNIARACRDQLLTIPDRCAALVAAESDSFNCKKILLDEISTVLSELTDRLGVIPLTPQK